MLARLWLLTKRTVQEYGDDNCSHMAAAISYYVLFSIIPLTIFTVSIFGLIVRDEDTQQNIAEEIVEFLNVEEGVPLLEPNEEAIERLYGAEVVGEVQAAIDDFSVPTIEALAAQLEADEAITLTGIQLTSDEITVRADNIVTDTLEGVANVSGALTVVGLVGMAWAASAMFGAIRKSLNIAWDTDVHRPVVQQKLVDLSLVLGLGILLGASIVGTGALRTLQALSDDNLGPLSEGSGLLWSVLPLLLPAVFTFLVFTLLYQYVPNVPTPFRDIWPGAVLATVLFELLKNLFALYIANFNNYAGAYGALGGLLLFLLWTYLTSNILLIGAELAAEYPRVMRGDYDNLPSGPSRPLTENVRRVVRNLFFAPFDDDEDEPNG
ncbi:MAG: YihY/virulence factor BrkB family protein [Chloroflexi bacterium]|nr:YihY/virulence factor BrkB family protein [Chloroflexota bacterium]